MGYMLVLTCEHAGNIVPHRWQKLFIGAEQELYTHRGIDIGAASLSQRFAMEWNVAVLEQPISRLLIDCNRSLNNPTLFSSFTKKLSKNEKETLIDSIWKPYRQRVKTIIESAIQNEMFVLHISLHSFTPELNGKERFTDIGILHDPRRLAERRFALLWQKVLQQMLPTFTINKNKPYRGQSDGFTTALRECLPACSYIGIELEVNQKFALDDNGHWAALCSTLARSLPLFQFFGLFEK